MLKVLSKFGVGDHSVGAQGAEQISRAQAGWGTIPKVVRVLGKFGPRVGDHSGGAQRAEQN